MAALAIVVVWMPALQAEQSHVTPTRHRWFDKSEVA